MHLNSKNVQNIDHYQTDRAVGKVVLLHTPALILNQTHGLV